ncbi:MAG: hypothetical protein M3163_00975 [Actinomycetota bacterium]|nr:hypothetical protein [Actinomycetota bacterium]
MTRRLLATLVAAVVAVTVAGCGSGEGVGQAASTALTPQVAAVRAAAEAGNRDQALSGLAVLRQTVARLRTSGDLTQEGAATVLEAAADVEAQLALLPAPVPGGGSPATSSAPRNESQTKAEEDARKRAEEAVKKAEEDAKKRAEEAVKKAEEDAKKRAEDAKKRAEEIRKQAEGKKD